MVVKFGCSYGTCSIRYKTKTKDCNTRSLANLLHNKRLVLITAPTPNVSTGLCIFHHNSSACPVSHNPQFDSKFQLLISGFHNICADISRLRNNELQIFVFTFTGIRFTFPLPPCREVPMVCSSKTATTTPLLPLFGMRPYFLG